MKLLGFARPMRSSFSLSLDFTHSSYVCSVLLPSRKKQTNKESEVDLSNDDELSGEVDEDEVVAMKMGHAPRTEQQQPLDLRQRAMPYQSSMTSQESARYAMTSTICQRAADIATKPRPLPDSITRFKDVSRKWSSLPKFPNPGGD